MASVFDGKHFNPEVFQQYVERIPNTRRRELVRSRALRPRPDLAAAMSEQSGGNYLTTPMLGLISGSAAQNYDGQTDLTASATETYSQSRVVVGRANGWIERDFARDLTGGTDFLENIAQQISDYWEEIDQDTIIAILNGVFSMTDADGAAFVEAHTYDVTDKPNSEGAQGMMDGTTLNTGIQKACGDNKGKFSLTIMHSMVATNLENLRLLDYMKYTDGEGIARDLTLATLNGRAVLVDDSMPVIEAQARYVKTADAAPVAGKTYYTRSGAGTDASPYAYAAAQNPSASDLADCYELADAAHRVYVTYVLGDGAIEYTDCGARVPFEVHRDPRTHGGEDTLYARQRKCFAPYGISFTKASMALESPTAAELADGANWALADNGKTGAARRVIAHKAIPITRILSRG